VILKYSRPGDIVLDYFVGGGTTAVEAKLLGCRCIAKDINPACVGLTKEKLDFVPLKALFGDYSSKVEGDLSKLSLEDFLQEMRKVERRAIGF
jgi:tRNA G10  N-methylase Trm11